MNMIVVLVKMLLCLVLIISVLTTGAVSGGDHDLQATATEAVTDMELNPVKSGVEYNVYFYRRSRIGDKLGGIGVDYRACPPPIVEFGNEYSGASDLEASLTMSLHPVTPSSDGIVRRDTPVYIKLAKDVEFPLPSACPSAYKSPIWKVQEYHQNNNTTNNMIVTTGGEMGDLEASGVFVIQSVFLSPRANKISALLAGNNKPKPIVPFQPHPSTDDGDDSYFYLGVGDEKATDPFRTGGPFKVAFLKKPTSQSLSSIIHPFPASSKSTNN